MHIYKSTYPPVPLPTTGLFQTLSSRPIPLSLPAYIDYPTKRSFTRGQAFDAARKLAKGLKESKGAKLGEVALIFCKTSVDYPIVVLGCIAAGLIPSLASAAYTPQELAHQIQDSQASYVFVDPDLLPILIKSFAFLSPTCRSRLGVDAPVGIRFTTILLAAGKDLDVNGFKGYESVMSKSGGYEEVVPQLELKTRTALLCYSSGTTGLSKGVELTHMNLSVVLDQLGRGMPPVNSGKDSCVGFLPMYHIYGGVKQMFLPLFEGYSIIVIPKFSIETFCKVVQEYKCTFGLVAPPVLMGLSASPVVGKYDVSSLKWLLTGAAACGEELTLKVERRFASTGLVVTQGYGSTESSPGCTTLNAKMAKAHRGAVGLLNPSMEARLIGDDDQDVPVGERGELWIRGPNVMKGYLRNPAATANALTSDGWYKTGDIVTISSEGIFRVVDRKKELIKYKGLQVAPGELEAVMLGHEEIADVGVVGVWSEKLQTELPRAYIVPAKGLKHYPTDKHHKQFADSIHAWLKPKVAHYKQLVGGIVLTEDFPRLPSGKILRRKLKERAQAEIEAMPVKARL